MAVSRKLLILPPVVLGALVLAAVVATRGEPAREPAGETAARVRVLEVAAMPFVPRLTGYGTVAPGRSWSAVAQVAGRVARTAPELERGARVAAGTEIVKIADEDYQLAVAKADADINAAQAGLDELAMDEANLRTSLEIEQRALALAERDLQRQRDLVRRGNTSQASVDDSELAVVRQRATVQGLENDLRLMPTKRRTQELAKAVDEADLATALLNLDRTAIRTPFEGRIAEVKVEATQYVGVGEVLATLDGIDTAEVDMQVPQSRMKPFSELGFGGFGKTADPVANFRDLVDRAGLSATVRLRFDDRDIEWPGRLARVSDTVDPSTRTVGLIVVVDEPYARARPGERPPLIKDMFVQVELRAAAIADTIVVPRSAVRDGAIHVVGPEARLERRPVSAMRAFGDLVVVGSGLAPGDMVVLDDLPAAIPGMLLTPVPDAGAAEALRRRAAGEAGRR
ncbi:efflux RND transporter periplasmic adaptor subunit [Thalassobaculum sp.]|uniref:efflux RND transporter periplasmic adaptor subunit n=1 Tax=Thalassobaculum sp. TaxID=2022740 RepID=UPI0032EB1074